MHGFLLLLLYTKPPPPFSLPHTNIERESKRIHSSSLSLSLSLSLSFARVIVVVSTAWIHASLSKHHSPMDQEEQRHICRFCSKIFPCGRSLGGHMRSHMSSSSSTSFAEESKLGCGAAGNGYGLRENPKKTWRLSCDVDDDDEVEKQCRECGKEFRSGRALFGHMRCHSSSHDKREVEEEEEEEEDGSRSGAAAAADGEALVRVPKKKRRPRRPAAMVASSASDEHEQEDVAISLMMLSRDAGYWRSSPDESSDKNSAILEEDRDWNELKKPNSYKDGEFYYDSEEEEESKKGGSCVKKRRRRRRTRLDHVGVYCNEDGYGGILGIKSRYECATCKKSFHSYQALGGHRASHKRLKGRGCCSGGGGESTTSQLDADTCSFDPTVFHSGKAKARNHQCGVCGKVFASGQALGGHKRSHLVMSSPMIVIEEVEAVVVMPDLLDLNMPAPVDDDDSSNARGIAVAAVDAEFDSWWAGSNLKSEAMVGLTENR